MFWILSVSIKVVGIQVRATMPSSPEVSLFVLLTISLTETTKDPPVPLLGQLQDAMAELSMGLPPAFSYSHAAQVAGLELFVPMLRETRLEATFQRKLTCGFFHREVWTQANGSCFKQRSQA